MTTNLAQVFLTDDEWQSTLENAFEHCVPRGRIAPRNTLFESDGVV